MAKDNKETDTPSPNSVGLTLRAVNITISLNSIVGRDGMDESVRRGPCQMCAQLPNRDAGTGTEPGGAGARHSASHFSHFLTYLSSRRAMSRMTNVSTTLAKNSDARRSFISDAAR